MSSSKSTIAFFGATGGCTASAVAQALKEGHRVTALARTPEKLDKLMKTHGVSQAALENLTVIEGSISDESAVQRTLQSSEDPSCLADYIVCGIGGTPKAQKSFCQPFTLDNPHICEQATKMILGSLKHLATTDKSISTTTSGTKPVFMMISTTGISEKKRDVPVAFLPLYHWLLAVPHVDKLEAEKILAAAPSTNKGDADAIIEDWVMVRPSLLLDGESRGMDALRVGWEKTDKDSKSPGPAVGYTIRRADVGLWMMEAVVKGNAQEWCGKKVSLTY